MNNIADANATEMRGWVMLMLQRAAENVNPSECNDPAVLLACSLGSDSCPAACQKDSSSSEEETASQGTIDGLPIAGDLSIAVADYSSEVKSAPAVATVVFNAVDFKASEKVTIESVKLERTGLSDKSAIKGVWFEKDGIAVSAKASITSDGTATTRFYNGYSVNGTDTLDLVVELSGAAGSEIAFNIVGATSTAKNVSVNAKTTTYRTTNYQVAKVAFKKNGGNDTSYKVGEKNEYEIGRFEISNTVKGSSEDKDIIVKSLKLRNEGTADIASLLKNVKVYRDGKVVSKTVEVNSKDIVIAFDNEQIDSGKRAIYTIFSEVNQLDRPGDTVILKLNKDTELVAQEKNSGFRVAYDSTVADADKTLKTYTFEGGKVTFTNDSNVSKTVEAGAGSSDVVIAKGSLTVAEPVKFVGGLKIRAQLTNTNRADDTANTTRHALSNADIIKAHINSVKIEIGGSTYDAEATAVTSDNTSIDYKVADEIYVSKTSDVRVLVNLKSDDTYEDKITFSNLNAANAYGACTTNQTTNVTTCPKVGEYESTDKAFYVDAVAGTIQTADLLVKTGKFNLTNKNSSTQKVVVNDNPEVTIFDGELSSKNSKVSVTSLTVSKTSGTIDPAEQITITVYLNGESSAFSDATLSSTKSTVTFNNLGDLTSSTSMKVKITAQPNIATAKTFDFTVQAEGSDENGNQVATNASTAARLEITDNASSSIAGSSSSSTVVRDGANEELYSFTTTVKNGQLNLTSLKLVLGTNYKPIKGKVVEATIEDAKGNITLTSEKVTGALIDFGNVNETLSVGTHKIILKAPLNVCESTTQNACVTNDNIVEINSVLINGGNTTADKSASKKESLGVIKLVAKAYPTLSASTSSKELVLKISNPSDSTENLDILGFGIDGYVETASFDDKTILSTDLTSANFTQAIVDKGVSLAPGASTELRLQTKPGRTVQVTAIKVKAGDQAPYVISSDFTNVGKWTSFKVSSDANVDSNDTTPAVTINSSSLDSASVVPTNSKVPTYYKVTLTLNADGSITAGTATADANITADPTDGSFFDATKIVVTKVGSAYYKVTLTLNADGSITAGTATADANITADPTDGSFFDATKTVVTKVLN